MREQGYPAYSLGLLGQGLGMMPQLVGQTQVGQKETGPGDILAALAAIGGQAASAGAFGGGG